MRGCRLIFIFFILVFSRIYYWYTGDLVTGRFKAHKNMTFGFSSMHRNSCQGRAHNLTIWSGYQHIVPVSHLQKLFSDSFRDSNSRDRNSRDRNSSVRKRNASQIPLNPSKNAGYCLSAPETCIRHISLCDVPWGKKIPKRNFLIHSDSYSFHIMVLGNLIMIISISFCKMNVWPDSDQDACTMEKELYGDRKNSRAG